MLSCMALVWALAVAPPFALGDACYLWGPPRGKPGINMHVRLASRNVTQPADQNNVVWDFCLVNQRDGSRAEVDSGLYAASPAMHIDQALGHRLAFYIAEGAPIDARPLGLSIKLPPQAGWVMRATLKYESAGRTFSREYLVRNCP